MRARTRPTAVNLEGDGFVRFADVFPSIIPIGPTQARDRIAAGDFPKPVKIGRSSMLEKAAVRTLIERVKSGGLAVDERARA